MRFHNAVAENPTPNDPHQEARFARIRRLKRFLRHLPRRTNMHRYPFLKYFAAGARKRTYLWSIRPPEIIRAIYAGSVITILPIQGIQVPVACISSLLLKANLPLNVALQLPSNALTLPFIYAADYYLGNRILRLFLEPVEAIETIEQVTEEFSDAIGGPSLSLIDRAWNAVENCFELLIKKGPYFFAASCIGGVILGLILGVILHGLYRVFIHPSSLDQRTQGR